MILFTLKKHCPKCGNSFFRRIQRKGWMRLISGSKHYQCRKCSRKFLLLTRRGEGVEHRRFKRFRIKNGIYAIASSDLSELGIVEDVSRGGFSLLYGADKKLPEGPFPVDILCNGNRLNLKNILVTAVSDTATDRKVMYGNIAIKRCGLRCEEFSVKQKALLKYFMLKYKTA